MSEHVKSYSAENTEEKNFIQFSDIWKGIMKFWWLTLALGVAVSLLMFLTSYSKFRPQYQTSATFTVNTEVLSLTGEGLPSYSYVYDNATASNLADTFPYILSSDILTEAIREDLDIPYVPATLSAKAVSSTNMFTLTATGSEPQKTYDVLVSAMKNYPAAAKYLVGNVQLTMITEPQIPEEPINKFTFATAFKGFGIGLLIGAAWIFVYALLRKTIKTKSDIKQQLKLGTVGTIPEVTFKKYRKQEIDKSITIRNEKIGKGFLESIRVFRNSFLNLAGENDRVIMATSTAPGEGKTTAIVNLALSLSEAGRKVLLVDADMRNPSVALTLRLDADKLKPAGNDVYYRISELEDYGVSYLGFSDNKNLYWKIINVDYLKSVFDELRDSYDFILVDTPPCGLVSDTLVIAEACDALLYVILQDTVRVNRIRDGIDSLSHTDIHILGAVMNGAQSGFAGYGENYGYGYGSYGHYKTYTRYGYGYGYGYGYDYGGKKSGRHRVFSGKSEKQKKKSS